MSSENKASLSVEANDNVRAIHNRVTAARLRVEMAMKFTMHPEVREQLRCTLSDLSVALAFIEP